MGKLLNIIKKANPANLLKKKDFNAILFTKMSHQFALISMEQINDGIEHVGIELAYKGNSDRVGLIFIDSIKSKRVDDDAIIIFDTATKIGYQVYIMPSAAFKYTVYNKQGQITSTIIHTSGQDSRVIQISGSVDFYKIEGEIL